MIGILGRPIVLYMAVLANCRRTFVNIIDVTGRAGDGRVLARQWILGLRRMIELRALPLRRGVAQCAVLRESRRHVIRILGGLEVFQVAAFTSRRQAFEHVIYMARRAGYRSMFARKRKLGGVVIELRALPLRGGVAQFAGLRKTGGHVIHALRRLIILDVAQRTSRCQSRKLIIHMARRARHRSMFAR